MRVGELEVYKSQMIKLVALNRKFKIAIQILVDSTLSFVAFAVAILLGKETLNLFLSPTIFLGLIFSTVCMVVFFASSGLYRSIIRFITGIILQKVCFGVLLGGSAFILFRIYTNASVSTEIIINYSLLLFLLTGGARFFVRQLYRGVQRKEKKITVIYGAGEAGRQLQNALVSSANRRAIVFIDDNAKLQGMNISGCRVYSAKSFANSHWKNNVSLILLALPTITRQRRSEIVGALEGENIEIKSIPSITKILSGEAGITEFRTITPEMLLGRDAIPPVKSLIEYNNTDKIVLVTGAGGSIGSELCEQIIAQNPRKLILLDHSELALYQINEKIKKIEKNQNRSIVIVPVLGSVCDEKCVDTIIRNFCVETIYHAAAYKHVPLVEENVVDGVVNNVFGTLTLVRCAAQHGVDSFTLISTDKAVRPTNVMGASKRCAELICQAYAAEAGKIKFSMVRFGNVLGSSGSVIPLFQKQIEAGGPLTVTDPEITRYFMTIREAAELVLHAGAMTTGGDVFVLDMGAPIKISDLAIRMIKLSGSTPYFVESSQEEPKGAAHIGISFTGLRKGEKLYEELLVGSNSKQTEHPRIMKAQEVSLSMTDLVVAISQLREACNCYDAEAVIDILNELPLGFAHNKDGA